MIVFFFIYALACVAFAIHLFLLPKKQRTTAKIIELLLLYQIVFSLGITSLLSFFALNFMSNTVQHYIEWPPCPYQQELANVNLSFGILGILAIWFRKSFWIATILGFSIWIFGDALHHIYLLTAQGESLGNKLLIIFTDFFIPVVLCILLWLYIKTNPNVIKENL